MDKVRNAISDYLSCNGFISKKSGTDFNFYIDKSNASFVVNIDEQNYITILLVYWIADDPYSANATIKVSQITIETIDSVFKLIYNKLLDSDSLKPYKDNIKEELNF